MKKAIIVLLFICIVTLGIFCLKNNRILYKTIQEPVKQAKIDEEDPLLEFDYEVISANYDNKNTKFAYNDGLFLKDSNEFSTDIAKMGVSLSVAAYNSNQISEVLARMGFSVQRFYNYTDYEDTPEGVENVTLFKDDTTTTMENNDFVAFSISNKEIAGYMVYIVAVRGTPSTAEWFSDFRLSKDNIQDNETGNHYGFYTAADEVKKCLKGVLEHDSYDSEHTIVLTTGHSRGAAVANIIAGELTTKYELSQYVQQNHVFGYTFACPYVSKYADDTLLNIYNFNNPGDLIPQLPKYDWGYRRYGKDKMFEETDWKNVNQRFREIYGKEPILLHETENVINILSYLVNKESDFYKPLVQMIFKFIAYNNGGKNSITTLEWIEYLAESVGNNKAKYLVQDGGIEILKDEKTLEKEINEKEELQKAYQKYQNIIEAGIDILSSEEDGENSQAFKNWLQENEESIAEIEYLTGTQIKDSNSTSYSIQYVHTEIGALIIKINEVLEMCYDLKTTYESIGMSISELLSAITDGHLSPTYVILVNSKYFGYEGWKSSDRSTIYMDSNITSIGDNCFENCINLQSILEKEDCDINCDINYIGREAFANLSNLERFNGLSQHLLYVGDMALYNCNKLSSNNDFGTKTKHIGEYAFYGCNNLTGNLSIADNIKVLGEGAFNYCSKLKGKLKISGELTEIKRNTFNECRGIEEIEIGDGIEELGNRAFALCIGLKKVKMPISTIYNSTASAYGEATFLVVNGIEEIEFTKGTGETFNPYGNENYNSITSVVTGSKSTLKKVVLEDGIKRIYDYAFLECENIEEVKLSNSLEIIGNYAFCGCSKWNEELNLPETVKEIGTNAFSGCSNLKGTLELPKNIEEIGARAFQSCRNITGKINILGKLTEIKQGVFSGCEGVEEIEIGDNIERIGENAFSLCTGVKKIKMPISTIYNSTASAYGYATFLGTNGIEEIEFTKGTGEIFNPYGNENYNSITSVVTGSKNTLKKVVLEDGIKEIYEHAFRECENLEEVKLPNNLEIIGNYAFYFCSNWNEELILPETIKEIGSGAFHGCTRLTGNLKLPDNLEYMGADVFNSCIGLTGNLIIGQKLTNINGGTFAVCTGLTGIEIADNIKTIERSAFQYCTEIKKVKIPISTTYDSSSGAYGYATFLGTNGIEEIEFTKGTGEVFNPNENNDYRSATSLGTISKSTLKKVVLEDGIKEIYENAFRECENLEEVKLPNSLEIIGDYAFYGCNNWNQDLKLPETTMQIGSNAFKGCTNLYVDYNLENNNHQNYEFDGWYTDDNFTNKFTGDAENQNTTIYVHWKPLVKLGDVNGDGDINVADYTMIIRYIKGYEELTEKQKLCADVNKDGDINVADYTILIRYIKGYETIE